MLTPELQAHLVQEGQDWFREKYLPALNAGIAKPCIDRHPRCSNIENGRCVARLFELLGEFEACDLLEAEARRERLPA